MKENIQQQLNEPADLKKIVADELADKIAMAAEVVIKSLKNGNKLLLAGNGGSASDAQHIAGEFIGRYKKERRALPAIALTTDTSVLTAISNDYDFSKVFSRQIEALGQKGDVLVAISTSGNSPNILKAVESARSKKIFTIGLTGRGGGQLKDICDLAIIVPSDKTERIQEAHITIGHIISELAEKNI